MSRSRETADFSSEGAALGGLERGQVHLWLAFQDDLRDERLLQAYRALLSEEERAQEQRFRFSEDQHRCLIARALVRTTLSRYVPVAPHEWRFQRNDYGRPAIARMAQAVPPLSFNVTHTKGLVACAVALAREVGVDAENMRHERASIDIADRYFSPSEAKALRELPEALQPTRFFSYWTLKESYIKAKGQGLSIPLDAFSFDLSDESTINIAFHPPLADSRARWQFWLLAPSAEHFVALCVERSGPFELDLAVRRVVPLVSDEPMACPVLRRSAD